MEQFDSRGVRSTYGVSLDAGVLRMWSDRPGFHQPFSATLGPDAFECQWPLAETPGGWQDDLKVTYRRRGRSWAARRVAEFTRAAFVPA